MTNATDLQPLLSNVADCVQKLATTEPEFEKWNAACQGIAKLLRTGWPFPDPKLLGGAAQEGDCPCGATVVRKSDSANKSKLCADCAAQEEAPSPDFKEKLTQLLIETVRLAIVRWDLRDESGEDIGEDEAVNLAQDTAWAMQGEGTCDETPAKEWSAVIGVVAEEEAGAPKEERNNAKG